MERDINKYLATPFTNKISTHTLTWSVTISVIYQLQRVRISTHTLTWSVTCTVKYNPMCLYNFNSHAHVERDSRYYSNRCILKISTHTLTWSVTSRSCTALFSVNISTHTLTWSVTGGILSGVPLFLISTHTLTWSVTRHIFSSRRCYTFQLTRSRGA